MLHFSQPNPTIRHITPSPPSTVDPPNGPIDLKVTSYLNRVFYKATEPSSLFGMIVAGALFRVTKVSLLTRWVASPGASLWTREAVAGMAGFAVEGAALPLVSGLAAKGMGRHPDWSGEALVSSYIFLGGLRAGGLFARACSGLVGTKTALSNILFHQVGMLGGIHLGYQGSLGLAQSLAMLVDFNIAGSVAARILAHPLAAWEHGMIHRAKLRQTQHNWDSSFLGPELSLVNGGRVSHHSLIQPQEERGPTRSLMSSTSESGGGAGYDRTGIEILRPLKTLQIPRNIPMRIFIKDWIKAQKYPIAVAMKAGRFGIMPRIIMVNEPFERVFDWPETLIRGTSVRELFKDANLTLSRIISGVTKSMRGRPVEFEPIPLEVKVRYGDKVPCVGAGIYLPIEKVTYAFGVFTQISHKTLLGRPIDFIPPAPLPLPPGLIESLRGSPKFIFPQASPDFPGSDDPSAPPQEVKR